MYTPPLSSTEAARVSISGALLIMPEVVPQPLDQANR